MKDLAFVTRLVALEKRDILYSILFGFIAGISAVGLFAASGYLISKSAFAPPLYALIILTSTVKLLGFTRAMSKYAERYFSHRATFTILSNVRVAFFEKLEPLAPGIFQKYRSGDLLARIVGDVESLQNFFIRVFYPPIVLIMVFLSTVLFTTFFSVYISIIILVGLILTTFLVPALFSLRQAKIDSAIRQERGKLSTEVTEFLHGYRDLKIYQRLGEKGNKVEATANQYLSKQETESIHKIRNQSINAFIALFITWTVLVIGALLVVNGQLEGIFLAMLLMISITAFEDVGPMGVFPIYLQETRTASSRLVDVVNEEVKYEELDDLKLTDAPTIKIDKITFAFSGEWRNAIQDVSMDLPTGSKTAIVGPSGSGKSTLLLLILKMIEAEKGNVMFNDKSINQLSEESIWKECNVVLQENHFFFGTIRDNLQLAGEHLTDEELADVLSKVNLDDFQLDDPVLEKGDNLSGGEKQRLAIARAILKQGKLWLLDEPTSSVDALTEKFIFENLYQEAKEDTLVLVSHRLGSLEKMDQIIVMDQGKIVESGTFDELIAAKGYFYQMKEIEKGLL
ncbi:thiol reductant ABC exporter subunit CydC [Ornithinibacillus halophilus]|uniref:ATP-binding cassette, subfamily C, CydC n=1 Tax=Ornithinibacillus halophilus TaxID=930117 RepID=A0A1M5DZD1_9BACI|nr:thiol reductant ABC exporter subunit CydC [Ornithinibacillus halophilus]SHF72305.1 ATP-binding cassette, subfamily C, CydC [Ornithinibacillus halophilus]